MSLPKIVIDTDLFVNHLYGRRRPSLLRLAHRKFFCYTTVFHAIELFSLARSETDLKAMEGSMASLKVLGMNAKGARLYARLLRGGAKNQISRLIAGMCLESNLPLLTGRKSQYRVVRGLVLVPASDVLRSDAGSEIIAAARKRKKRS